MSDREGPDPATQSETDGDRRFDDAAASPREVYFHWFITSSRCLEITFSSAWLPAPF
jgi:hypothetical protein